MREDLKMPVFECKVSRSVFNDDLKVTRASQNVYVEAKDEIEAKKKAGHPANWLKSVGTLGKSDKLSFLLTVDWCRRLSDAEVKDFRAGRSGVRVAPQLHQ
jgi:hypothetical protein